MTDSLCRAVGVGSINGDISDSVESLIATLNLSENSDEDYSEFSDEEDEEGQADEWDFGGDEAAK
jgi:hypothetical protein